MGKTTVTLLAAFFAFIPCAHGQTIAPQWTWPVSSDFGPRLVPGYDFHEGVDFNPLQGNADLGTPIPNLEGGPIFTVANNATFLEVQVQGRNTGHTWLYGHIFRNGVTDIDEYGSTTRHWELRKSARLVLPSDTSNEISHNVIIRWDGDTALSAITSIGGDGRWIVDDQGYCVQDANQNCIEAKAIAEAGDLIAPMGDAATTNVHLHLGLNYPDDNPYLDLQHPPDTLPTATILQPVDGHVMTTDELEDYGFKARVDSIGGLDLDKVSFWIYKNKDSAQAIHLGAAGLPTFGYGGRAGEDQNGLSYSSDGEATGVQPIADANGDTLGHDKFIFRQSLTALNLPDGEHSFVVRLKDVNGNEPEIVKTDFTIDRTGPAVTINTGFGEPYRAFTGESLKTPVSPNPGLAIDGKLKITIADSGAGVKSFVLEKPSPEASLTEDAAAGATTVYKELTGLSDGTYTLTAYDNNGNKTVVSFTLSDLALEPKISESASVYKTSDYFDASLRFKTAASLKIKNVFLYDSNGAEISRHASTSTAEMVLYQLTDLFNTTDFSRDLDENPAVLNYSVVLTDNESQIAKHRVSLELEKLDYPINLASQDSGETEISQLGNILPGAVIPSNAAWFYSPWFALQTAGELSGAKVSSQVIGTEKVSIITGKTKDLSDGVEKQLLTRRITLSVWDSENTPPANCYKQGLLVACVNDSAVRQTVDEYFKFKVTVEKNVLSGVLSPLCSETDSDNQNNCLKGSGYYPTARLFKPVEIWGVKYGDSGLVISGGLSATVPAGRNVNVSLASWLDLEFENVTNAGVLNAALADISYPNFDSIAGVELYGASVLAFSGPVKVSIKYDGADMTAQEKDRIEVWRFKNTVTKTKTNLEADIESVNGVVSFSTDKLGVFQVAVPAYDGAKAVKSSQTDPELSLISGNDGVSLTKIEAGTSQYSQAESLLAAEGLLPLSGMFELGPSGMTFSPAAFISMRYATANASSLGIVSDTLSIYQLSLDGSYLEQLPSLITDQESGEIVSEVSAFHSVFVVAGSTGTGESLADDQTPPVTSLGVVGTKYEDSGKLMISTSALVELSAVDPAVAGRLTSGVASTYYLVDVLKENCVTEPSFSGPAGGCENPMYGGRFSLSGGTHTVSYLSEDSAGNEEGLKQQVIYVDGAAPEVRLSVDDSPVSDERLNILPTTKISLAGEDVADGNPVSGLDGIFYLLDVPLESCGEMGEVVSTAPAGSCQNYLYSAPFTLSAGAHTIYYTAMDNVGNQAVVKAVNFTVSGNTTILPSSGPIGIPFVINGSGFGTYSSGITTVLIGDTTAPLTLWSTTTIKGTIPGSLSAGEYPVSVMRGTTTLAVASSFTVTTPVLYALTPSSGAIGIPFTVTGESFGNYISGKTQVLIGGTTAALTLWTDTKIQGTIPGTLAVGDYDLVVERAINGGVVRTSSAAFSLRGMEAWWLAPSSGPIGMPFTITGAGFGNYSSAYTHVLLGDTTAPLTLWTDGKIQGTVPGGLSAGQYPVIVERLTADGGQMRTSSMTFEVVTVDVASMTPVAGPIGLPFAVFGSGFGNYVSGKTRVLLGGTTAPLTLWTDSKIQGTVPGSLAAGDYELVVERELNSGIARSVALAFTVTEVSVASMTPVAGPIGMPFTIYGGNFGNYSSGNTKVLLGDTTCPLTLWTDTKIQGTVPGSLADGDYPVTVVRSLNGGVVQSSTLTFTVASPVAYTLSPSSGPIGLPFTITGDNFGNYLSGYTRVLIGGTTAPLTLWSTTTIKGTIPALVAGDYELYVERAINNGVVRTSTFAFTVADPALLSVSPATAAVVAAFTLGGYNFGNYSSGYSRVLINGATTTLTLWTDGKVQGKLPAALGAGTYPVQVQRAFNGGLAESATAYISVEEPVISSMTPVSGAVGAVFNLYGTGFGAYDSTIAKVFIGGTQSTLTLWTDTRITGTIPSGLTYGTHTVVAVRGQFQSNALTLNIPGGYTASAYRAYSPLALEFKLGEVYVYPDPAKGGKVPTFHVEVGQADSVRLKVYTVSGELVHERTLTGAPQAVGSTYAYEYPWEGRIASGVYYYTMEAERDGKKLKARGKFSVVR